MKSKRLLIPAILVSSYLAINYRWLRAASAAVLSKKSCKVELIEAAHKSVENLFVSVVSQPIFVCLNHPVLGYKLTHGQTEFAPGLPSVILLGREGMNIDVAAHEWAHAEFAQRIGIINKVIFIPTWFDEGLAMQVDFREKYNYEAYLAYRSQNNYEPIALEDISNSKFYAAGDRVRYYYAYSRCVVGEWLKDNPGWLQQIKEVGFFSKFPIREFDDLCNLN